MGKKVAVSIDSEESLLDYLREKGHFIPAWCGGKGTCGKCRVRFLDKVPEADDRDRKALSEQEIQEGWRLACCVFKKGSFTLELADHGEEDIIAADAFAPNGEVEGKTRLVCRDLPDPGKPKEGEKAPSCLVQDKEKASLALAVDIGTTTLAAALIDVGRQTSLATVTGINHQRVYGADVLSRIDAANQGKGKKLQELLLADLDKLCRRLGLGEAICRLTIPVIVSGNTTMQHLLQGLSCRGLGVFPFTPADLSLHTWLNMTILPGISAFAGADIMGGITACGMDRSEKISILIDLGTNGEMVLGNKDRMLVTSAAAGPAFEGGNIHCGMAGVPGAIESVEIREGQAHIRTLGGEPPAGICGSGVLETLYELLKEGIVDETGLLEDSYFDDGYPLARGIVFTAGDIREVQMAKSAIRTGIEILLASWGTSCDQIDKVYLAGGFGQRIHPHKAVGIGLLPADLEDRIVAVGNSSLEGAKMMALDPGMKKRFDHIKAVSEEISLSNHELFQDLYLKHMYLPPGHHSCIR